MESECRSRRGDRKQAEAAAEIIGYCSEPDLQVGFGES